MYCVNCGKNLADDAKFCDACGAPVASDQAAPAAEPVAAEAPVITPPVAQVPVAKQNAITSGFFKTLKGFFSKNTVRTVGESAKSTGMEWLLTALLCCLVYALALALNVKQIIDSTLGALSSMLGGKIYNFGIWLLYGLLISILSYFLMSFVLFGTVKLVFKKNVNIHCVFNLVATASLPLATAYVLNIILGFIWIPFIFIFSAAALASTAVLLYAGMQKLDKFETSPFAAYSVVWIIVAAVLIIVASICIKSAVESLVGNLLGDAMNSLDGLSGLLY